jgi:hypothetical protein
MGENLCLEKEKIGKTIRSRCQMRNKDWGSGAIGLSSSIISGLDLCLIIKSG